MKVNMLHPLGTQQLPPSPSKLHKNKLQVKYQNWESLRQTNRRHINAFAIHRIPRIKPKHQINYIVDIPIHQLRIRSQSFDFTISQFEEKDQDVKKEKSSIKNDSSNWEMTVAAWRVKHQQKIMKQALELIRSPISQDEIKSKYRSRSECLSNSDQKASSSSKSLNISKSTIIINHQVVFPFSGISFQANESLQCFLKQSFTPIFKQCLVCYELLQHHEYIIQMKCCKVSYHEDCIRRFLLRTNKCGFCLKKIENQ